MTHAGGPRGPQDLDRHIGERIRQRRSILGISQQELAEQAGVTYQQIHKYECGINRISASRLSQVAAVLSTDISYFFDGSDEWSTQTISPRQRMLLELAQSFDSIDSDRLQRAVCSLVHSLARPHCAPAPRET